MLQNNQIAAYQPVQMKYTEVYNGLADAQRLVAGGLMRSYN